MRLCSSLLLPVLLFLHLLQHLCASAAATPSSSKSAAASGAAAGAVAGSPQTPPQVLPEDQEQFFLSLDRDKDGDLDADELRSFVLSQVDRDVLPEASLSTEHGVQIAISRIGDDNDKQIKHVDLVKQWVALATFMTPHDVHEWLLHAVTLSGDLAGRFLQGQVTGLHLPLLLDPVKGPKFLQSVGVQLDQTSRAKIWAALKLRMLGLGQVPPSPPLVVGASSPRCGVVPLTWSTAIVTYPDTHLYRLFRRRSRNSPVQEDPWELVYSGKATTFSDRHVKLEDLFDYRVEAWNLIGVSPSTELHDVAPLKNGCGEPSITYWFRVLEQFVSPLYQASGLLFLAFLIFKRATLKPPVVAVLPASRLLGSSSSMNGNGGPLPPGSPSLPQQQSGAGDQAFGPDNLPELSLSSVQTSSGRRGGISDEDEPARSTLCRACRKKISRTTRHVCGSCSHTFCMACTAYHPHMDIKTPVGSFVASACGIDSKCRCFDCFGAPREPSPPLTNSKRKFKLG